MLGREDARGGGVTTRISTVLPHAVSFLRPLLGIAVLVAVAPTRESAVLLPLVLLGCLTDWVDGELARRSATQTLRGRLVDNFCDFAFLLCLFVFLAQAEVWTPPVWGRLARQWDGANWLPVYALLASFGVYFLRLCLEMAGGREPARSAKGHAAGVCNYILVVVGAVEMLPGIDLGPWLLEPAMVTVALLNVLAVPENVRLMFHRGGGAPRMPA